MYLTDQQKGDMSEAAVIFYFSSLGCKILKPFSNNLPYDLVIDNDDGTFTRVQVKTGRIKNNSISFPSSRMSGRSGKRLSYAGLIDVYAVYSPDLNKVFIVPIKDTTGTQTTLSLGNGGERPRLLARDYEVSNVPS